jgi:stearoyl-CoA desaturase (delta-9 desaturase)
MTATMPASAVPLERFDLSVMVVTGLLIVLMYCMLPLYLTLPTTIVAVCGIAVHVSCLYMLCVFFDTRHRFKQRVNWFMCFYILTAHIGACFGVARASWPQIFEALAMYLVTGFGVTAGMHRLWSHRSYKARFPTRLCLAVLASAANQGSIYHWCRDHLAHHKFVDTDCDPHNINRGFFYAHVGWLLLKKDRRMIDASKQLDSSHLLDDPIVYWNMRLNPVLDQAMCFLVPGVYGALRYDSVLSGVLIFGCLRWVLVSHATWCVNSVAHSFGDRPYRKSLRACESLFTSLVAVGEGWHNWHHAFPSDYANSEWGVFIQWNPSKLLIDTLARLGQVYDRKQRRHSQYPVLDDVYASPGPRD